MEEKSKFKLLNDEELLEAEQKISDMLKKIETDFRDTKEKGGQ